jgi:uncharacterized membrane protein YdjX (TVP38/TMEM64 family)
MHHLHDLLVSWGPLGVFVLATVESAGIPNPGGTDILLLVVTIARRGAAFKCAALAVIGSLIGTEVLFELVRRGGERYFARYTRSARGERFRAWFQRYGLVTVFIPALLPIPILPFKFFVACAAATGVDRRLFFLVILVARVPRYFGLAYLGAELGENSYAWLSAHRWHLLAIAGAIFIALYALIRRSGRKRLQ